MLMNLFGGHGEQRRPDSRPRGQVVGLTQQGVTNGEIGVIQSIDFWKVGAPREGALPGRDEGERVDALRIGRADPDCTHIDRSASRTGRA